MKLRCQLDQAWSSCTDYASEVRIVDFAIHRRRAIELRVVEDVEGFHPDIQQLEFCDSNSLTELDVEILNSRTMEKAPGRVAQLAKRLRREEAGIKRGLAIARVGVDLKRAGRHLRRVQQFVVYAIAERPKKGSVGIVEQSNRKSCGEARCA